MLLPHRSQGSTLEIICSSASQQHHYCKLKTNPVSPVYMASSNWQAIMTLPQLRTGNALRMWYITGEEIGGCVLQDDKCLYDYNVQNRVDAFVKASEQLASVTYGDDILIPFGSDFQWVSAHQYYKNVDKLIHYINKDGRINAFYSTPAEYVAVKHQYNHSWPLKTDDFFPYADCPVCYWTGVCCAVLCCAVLCCPVRCYRVVLLCCAGLLSTLK